ncbi:MAG: choice-of-anchor Q domain-containing protein [Anaerolineaceae bacterium]|nr:choice-of-anchor Q domain-containing protein [Anaerolineaceae bacterium]
MKTTSRLILAGILAVPLTVLSVLLWSEANIMVTAQDMVANDLQLQIDMLNQEPQAEIDNATTGVTYTVGTGTSSCDFETIKAALADIDVSDGDTLQLKGGATFNEYEISIEKDLIIEGGHAICGGTSTAPSTINAGGYDFVFQVNGSTVTLKNLVLTGGGNSLFGGGLRVVDSSNVTLDNTEISANEAEYGAGLYVEASSTVNFNGQIINNQATHGGGGLYIASGTVNIHDTVIEGNSSEENGGAALVNGGSLNLTGPLTLQNNTASNGGAIFAEGSSTLEFEGVVFGSEIGGNQAIAGLGGAVYLDSSTMTAVNTAFVGNQATYHGGAIFAYNSSLTISASFGTGPLVPITDKRFEDLDGSLVPTTSCNPFLKECSTLEGNFADSDSNNTGNGGAIYVDLGSMTMRQTYLHDNSAQDGGAIYQLSGSSTISNSLIHHNVVSGLSSGAGITNKSSGTFILSSVTITDNSGGAGFLGEATSVDNSIAWENGYQGFSEIPLSYSCNIDSSSNAGNAVNPQFVNPGAGRDYHLQKTSPAVDVCAEGEWQDLENRQRPFGPGYDMGAYEFIEFTINLPLILR